MTCQPAGVVVEDDVPCMEVSVHEALGLEEQQSLFGRPYDHNDDNAHGQYTLGVTPLVREGDAPRGFVGQRGRSSCDGAGTQRTHTFGCI
jgi:hypothetical protein